MRYLAILLLCLAMGCSEPPKTCNDGHGVSTNCGKPGLCDNVTIRFGDAEQVDISAPNADWFINCPSAGVVSIGPSGDTDGTIGITSLSPPVTEWTRPSAGYELLVAGTGKLALVTEDETIVFEDWPHTGIAIVGSDVVTYLDGEEISRHPLHPEILRRLNAR